MSSNSLHRLFHSWLLLKRHQVFFFFTAFLFLLLASCLYLFANHSGLKDLSYMFPQRGDHILGQKLSILGDARLSYYIVGSSAFRNGGSTTQSRNQLFFPVDSTDFWKAYQGFIFSKCFERTFKTTNWWDVSLF